MANLMSRRRGDRATLRVEYRFGLVLLLLLATFAFLMVGSTSQWARPVSVALTGATLVAALYASEVSRRWRRLATVVAVIALLAAFSIVAVRGAGANGTAAVLDAALVVVAPIAIARSVARRGTIDVETVLAALCIYVIFGLLWGFIYNAIGNFASSPFFAQPITPTSADYLYFSFITQLTVGYGDLTPAGSLGRACAVFEGLIGQLYLVTIVAVVVSRMAPRSASPSRAPDPQG